MCEWVRRKHPRDTRWIAGFSLVELLVSVALGSILLAGMVRVFDGFQRSSALDRSITELQEQGRYAVDYISERIRYRGFQGCLPPSVLDITTVDTVDTDLVYEVQPVATALSYGTLPELTLISHDINQAGNWSPATRDAGLTQLASGGLDFSPKEGTDVILLRYASSANMPLNANMATDSAPITLDRGPLSFSQGDYVFVGDCLQADVFQVTNTPDPAAISLEHGTGGNTRANLTRAYDTNAVVRSFNTVAFFVAETGRLNRLGDPIYALYEMDTDNQITEVIDGVENMQVLYGVMNDSGLVTFVNSSSGEFDSRKVVTVRVALLMRSRNLSKTSEDTTTYSLVGESIGPEGNITHGGNKYMRQVFQTTVQMRNRG